MLITVAADGAAADDATYEAKMISFILVVDCYRAFNFCIICTFGVRRELSEVIAAKEGAEVDPKKTFIVSVGNGH